MRIWMITWKPSEWPELPKRGETLRQGGEFVESWKFGFRKDQPQKGDRVFLKRTHDDGEPSSDWPNGIVAAGHIDKDGIYDDADPGEAQTPHVLVRFDWVQEDLDDVLPIELLKDAFPDFNNWEPRNSGSAVTVDPYQLELMWAKKIGYDKDIFNVLKVAPDIDPFSHDPSYQLIQKAVDSYVGCDFGSLSFKDLDFVYMMVHILKDPTKRRRIEESSLPQPKKDAMLALFDDLAARWSRGEYENRNLENCCGLFIPGFHTFDRKGRDDDLPEKMIRLLVEVRIATTREDAYKAVEDSGIENWMGIAPGSLSEMLHCLRPADFPIMNSHGGLKDIYTLLLPNKKRRGTTPNYMEWTRDLAKMKDELFPFRNFRVIDLAQRILGRKDDTIDYFVITSAIKKHTGDPWQKKTDDLSQAEQDALAELNTDLDAAKMECKKLIDAISLRFGLKSTRDINFKKNEYSAVRHIRDYVWLEFKNPSVKDSPISVSVFPKSIGGKNGKMAVSVQLEIYDADADGKPEIWSAFHKHLDLPLNTEAGLTYSVGSNQYSNVEELNKQVADIKAGLANGTLTKVSIVRLISAEPPATNESINEQVMAAIEAILPYYEYCVGIGDGKATIAQKANEPPQGCNTVPSGKKIGLNTILYGPPGTGKTYNAVIWAVAICEQDKKTLEEVEEEAKANYLAVKKRYDKYLEEGRIAFTTFHQSYAYEDFIEGIKPKTVDNAGKKEVVYETIPGSFRRFCAKARPIEGEEAKPCVFIIDEINRGNISKIFGELITLIESSKREGAKEKISAKLPYSGDDFSVPSNVYILGTMNTADRSIALMDTALRRRFFFEEMMPDAGVLRKLGIDKVNAGGKTLDVAAMLETMNRRIEVLYDREHTLGHALFMRLMGSCDLETLAVIFKDSIIPLLQEYFYEDYEKIQLVLGDNAKDPEHKFIKDIDNETTLFKGSVDVDLPKKRYQVNLSALNNIDSYIEII